MNAETRGFPRGDIRVSDAERDLAVAELSEHFQAGRLTHDEFDERSGRALESRTWADLSGLFTDLPHQGTVPTRPAAPSTADPFLGPAQPRPWRGMPVTARFVIACVLVATVLGGAFSSNGQAHPASWVLPAVILGLVLLRLTRRVGRR